MAGQPGGRGRDSGPGRARPPEDSGVLETTVLGPGGGRRARARSAARVHLLDVCADFLSLAAAVRHAEGSADPAALRARALELRTQIEQRGRDAGLPAADIEAATFALVALLDETVLKTRGPARDAWLMKPLQLELYGQTVAGEEFFERLEKLRRERSGRIEALEVYFACLALGFGGRYNLAGPEKLAGLLAEVGSDIAAVRGAPARVLSPHLATEEEYAEVAGGGVPVWLSSLVFALAVAAVWIVVKLLALHGAGGTADLVGGLPR